MLCGGRARESQLTGVLKALCKTGAIFLPYLFQTGKSELQRYLGKSEFLASPKDIPDAVFDTHEALTVKMKGSV